MVNITITPEMTKEAVIEIAHRVTAMPLGIIMYIIFGVILFLSAWGFKEKDSSWGRFFWIWATTMIAVGAFLIFFIYSPNAVQWIVTKWEILWS